MPKIFDKIKDALTEELPITGSIRRAASRVTPNALERRIPSSLKRFLAEQAATPGLIITPRKIATALSVDHDVGLNLAQAFLPKNFHGVNVEGLGAELLRPSNLLPVSKASQLLKARRIGPPLFRALAQEGAVAGAFAGAETARLGGSPQEVGFSTATGFGLGAITPVGLEGLGSIKARHGFGAPVGPTSPVGAVEPHVTRMSNMTPEEQREFSKTRTMDEFLAVGQQDIERTKIRVQQMRERIETPLTDRPAGAKSGGVYLDDLFTVDGARYPISAVRADAGETDLFPAIHEGSFNLPGRIKQGKLPGTSEKGPARKIYISPQEAEVLRDLYQSEQTPTARQVRQTLQFVVGGSSTKVKSKDVGLGVRSSYEGTSIDNKRILFSVGGYDVDVVPSDNDLDISIFREKGTKHVGLTRVLGMGTLPELRELQTFISDLVDSNPNKGITAQALTGRLQHIYERFGFEPMSDTALLKLNRAKFEKSLPHKVIEVRDVTLARALQIKEYIDTYAPRSQQPIRRPLPTDTPALRAAVRTLRDTNGRIQGLTDDIEKLDIQIAQGRRSIEARLKKYTPERIIMLALRKERAELVRGIENLSASNPTRRATNDRIVEMDKMIYGETPIPEEFLTAAQERFKPPELEEARTTQSALEEEWRNIHSQIQTLEGSRAELLGKDQQDVPLDWKHQENIIVEKYGSISDSLPPVLPGYRAKEVLDAWRTEVERVRLKNIDGVASGESRIALMQDFLDGVKSGLTENRLPYGMKLKESSDLFARWKAAVANYADNPRGITKATVATETLDNYGRLMNLEAMNRVFGDLNLSKDLNLRRLSVARELQSILKEVKKDTGAHPFIIDPDGTKVFGDIASVSPVNGEFTADFRPLFTPGRDAQLVPIKNVHLEYAGDSIANRGKMERGIFERSREVSEEELTGADPMGLGQTLAELRAGSGLRPLTDVASELRTPEQLQQEVLVARKDLMSNMMPLLPGGGNTTQARLENLGRINLIHGPLPKSKLKAAEAVEARNRLSMDIRDYWEETSGLAFDDPDVVNIVDANGDIVRRPLQLLGRTGDIEDFATEPSAERALFSGPSTRRIRGAMNFMKGAVLNNRGVKSANALYHGAREGFAATASFIFDSIELEQRRLAVELRAKNGATRTSRRPRAFRFAFGDTELTATLRAAADFTPRERVGAELQGVLERLAELPENIRNIVYDHISSQPRFHIDYPELFNLPEAFRKVALVGQTENRRVSDLAVAIGGKGVSTGYNNRMMFDHRILPHMDIKILAEGHPLEVIAEGVRAAIDNGFNPREMLVTGSRLTMAEPMAHFNSALMHIITEDIKRLADPEATITAKDITHEAGRWNIHSLDKWAVRTSEGTIDVPATKELRDSLKAFEQGLNRLPDWKGLQGVTQQIAKVVLSADLNFASVQFYAGFASKALYSMITDPINSSKIVIGKGPIWDYVDSIKSIMSDEGWHSWYKAHSEEIQYLSSINALKVGQESFIAGPTTNKMPLENMPFGVGAAMRGIGSFNDLQFNRWLLFVKFNGIQHNMHKAQVFRKLGPTSSQFFLRGGVMSDVVEEAAGESPFYYGQPEQVVQSIGRTQSNKLGGIDLNVQGISQWRQSSEQIMTITPGFLRAQIGMISTALSRPHSVEGWIALSGIAEEVAFAAAVATGIAYFTGNLDKLNLTDMTRADWMAAPIGGDDYIPIIPRVGIPRLAARVMKEVIDAAQGDGFDGDQAIQAFAQGRLSPAVSALLPVLGITDTDFLGRRYRDKKDRIFASLTSFAPIFAENIATDARENVAQSGWSGLTPLTYQTPLQFLGKNIIPRPPIEKLDEFALQYTTAQGESRPRKWSELSKPEQEQLRENPQVEGAYQDFTYYQERRDSPKEQQIEAQFKISEQLVDALRTQPVSYKGQSLTMSQAYDLLLAGEIDGDDYRERLRFVNGQVSATMDSMDASLRRLGFNLDEAHDKRVERLSEIFKGADQNSILTQLAVWDSEQVQPEDFQSEVTVETPDGPVTFEETDWEAFQREKNAVLARYSNPVRLSALAVMDKWEDEGVDAYRVAAQLRTQIEEIPRYRGLTVEQAEKVDAITSSFRDASQALRARIGLPGSRAPLPRGANAVLRRYVLKQLVQAGKIRTQDDVKLASIALLMEENSKIREAIRNPDQLLALIHNPDVLLFYPYLLGRVPVWARNRLPESLRPQLDIEKNFADVNL